MKFLEGENVLAKMPNSEEFTKGKIINVRGGKYKVQFKGGVEHVLTESDLKAQRTSRSQTRTKGRPAKSPSRYSPSRKSPSRRSPARSPNQARKLPVRSARQAKISITRLEIAKDNSSDTDMTEGSESLKDDVPIQSRLRELGPITRRSIRIMSSASKAEHDQKLMMLSRGVDRAASLPVEKRAHFNALSEGKERGLSVQRDEDMLKMIHYEDDTDVEPTTETKQRELDVINKPQEWGGWVGALILIFALPVGIIWFQIACSNNYCSQKLFRIPQIKEWRSFFNLHAFFLNAVLLTLISIISILPIGKLVDGPQNKNGIPQHRINGTLSMIASLAAFGLCKYQGYDVTDFIIKKTLPLSVAGWIYGSILAVALYIKGGRIPISNQNMYGSTNNPIYNFWQGREIIPQVGPFDIKLIMFRFTCAAVMIINVAIIVKIINEAESLDFNNLNVAAILAAAMQSTYILDSFIFEGTFVTSFEISYEGMGYMLSVGYLMYPYYATLPARYLLVNRVHPPVYVLVLAPILFICGLTLYRMSNNLKDAYRKNPLAPSLSHLETIPTKRGKRLIVSGLWGFVRHPNYLGDIMMHSAIALVSWSLDVLPLFPFLQITSMLIHRALRDNARCKQRYGYAWEQYCSRVKYMILKPIF